MSALLLTPAELEQITSRKRSDAQRRELIHLGVPFKERRDHTIVVLRADFERATGGKIKVREPELLP